jgi:hypothetical protein
MSSQTELASFVKPPIDVRLPIDALSAESGYHPVVNYGADFTYCGPCP